MSGLQLPGQGGLQVAVRSVRGSRFGLAGSRLELAVTQLAVLVAVKLADWARQHTLSKGACAQMVSVTNQVVYARPAQMLSLSASKGARTDRICHLRHLGVLLAEQRSRLGRQRGHHLVEIDPGHEPAHAAQCHRNERVPATSASHRCAAWNASLGGISGGSAKTQ